MIANIKLSDGWVRNKCNNCPFSIFIHERGTPDHYNCFLGYGEFLSDRDAQKYFPNIKPHCELEVKEDEV